VRREAKWYVGDLANPTFVPLPASNSSCTSVIFYISFFSVKVGEVVDLVLSSMRFRFRPRSLRTRVAVDVSSPCYLDEKSPIVLRVTNEDEIDVDVSFDVLLQPTEDDAG
jgi:hypothetical protein